MTANDFDVAVVGAGFAGIGAAVQLKRLGFENLVIFEREDDLGGTWYVNRYPGVAVDVVTTTYSYSFEPNPHWRRLFSTGAEIKEYADRVADKYDVRRHIRFGTAVESAVWDDDTQVWRVALAGGKTVRARYLITATGFLSQPRLPEIPGITDFAGRIIHTADWDADYRPDGQRVAVIGTGATAVQLIPELARSAAELTVYQRTPIWVVPKVDIRFPGWARRMFARFPVTQRALRAVTDALYEAITVTALLRHRYFRRLTIAAADLAKMQRFFSVRDKDLRAKLTPEYDFGCKRPTFSNDYYRTFTEPQVQLQTGGVDHIEPDGIVNADGQKTRIDTLVLATGFDLWEANFPAIEVVGRTGRNLGKWWRNTHFQAYQGISMPYFPNYLSLAAPYAFLGLNFFNTMEYQMRHMDRLFTEMHRRGATTFEVTEEANDRYLQQMQTLIGDSLFKTGNCAPARSYYFDSHGEPTLLRPMSTRAAIREASRFPVTDYQFS